MAVFPMLSAVAGFIKVRYLVDKANIDNVVFRAHYRITTAILFGCCILVTANNLIGEYYYFFFLPFYFSIRISNKSTYSGNKILNG